MNKEDKLVVLSRQLLDESLEGLDESILTRLRESRQKAVRQAAQQNKGNAEPPFSFPVWLAPVGAGATFATVILTIALFWMQPLPQHNANEHFIEDLSLLTASEELEFYQDIEFYLWLEDEYSS
ncbi:MAG TPA: hypothetical protein ENK06_09025 [Gammaproteobacteria bacterium]|nr:hypothetical protein [Gammaproteobacteria bacterium]